MFFDLEGLNWITGTVPLAHRLYHNMVNCDLYLLPKRQASVTGPVLGLEGFFQFPTLIYIYEGCSINNDTVSITFLFMDVSARKFYYTLPI